MADGLMEPSYSFIDDHLPETHGYRIQISALPLLKQRLIYLEKDLWLFDGYDQVKQLLEPGPARLVDEPGFSEGSRQNGMILVNMQIWSEYLQSARD